MTEDPNRIAPAVAEAFANRKTTRAFGDPAAPRAPDGLPRATLEEMLRLAGNAPFHYAAHPEARGEGPREPWRAYPFEAPACRSFIAKLDPADNPNKIPTLLAAAEALICVTWLPDPTEEGAPEMNERNIEHVAAASSFVQSLLTVGTALGLPNFWSTGGLLQQRKYLEMMGARPAERLLGAVFFFPRDLSGLELKGGALRPERSAPEAWTRWVAAT